MSHLVSLTQGFEVFQKHRSSTKSNLANLWFRRNQAAALALLLIAGPVMAVVALLLWLDDGAPMVFGHYRVGQGGKLFKCLKFRTMRKDAEVVLADLLACNPAARLEWARDHKLINDPRITRLGRILRKTSLDELPQLINVLRGEMALVGPRPITVAELARYGCSRWHYLTVLPGMTGLWQVSGRNNLSYDQRVELDRRYVTERSVWMDISIILRTFLVAFGRGAR